ncbi:unnamed protein product [Camellia sinensis]
MEMKLALNRLSISRSLELRRSSKCQLVRHQHKKAEEEMKASNRQTNWYVVDKLIVAVTFPNLQKQNQNSNTAEAPSVSSSFEFYFDPSSFGYLLGNPLTNLDDDNYRIPFAHGMGLISDELYESLQRSCQGEYSNIHPSNARCLQDYQAYSQCIDGLPKDQILEPYCGFDSPKPQELFSERRFVNEKYIKLLVHQLSPCDFSRINAYKLSHLWVNNDRVREALHIRKGSTQEWIRCNYGLPYTKSILDSFQYHVNLSTKGYRSLIYSGDHDIEVPFLGTQAWIRALNYSIVDEWRSWWVQGQVAGYTRTYSNRMTFATVKGLSGIQHCDYGLSWLWRSCKQLKKLQLRSCYAIGDESSLSSFVECLIGLQEVELWTCRAIINECDDQSGKQDAKEQEMECLVVGDAAVSEPGETKSFGEEKISTSSMFETDALVPEIEKTEKQDVEAQASNDLILQDALLKHWWTDMDERLCMDGRLWMLFFTDIEVDEDVEQEDKPGVQNLSISVFYKRQSSQVKVLFISLLLRAFTSNSAESSDRDDNSGLSISDCMEKCWNNCSCVGFTTSNSNASPEKFSGFQIKHSRGGGHIAPEYRPVECYAMFKRWISNQPL